MWLLTLGPGKARQGEFLREAERRRRYVEAMAYLSSRGGSNPNVSRDLQAGSDLAFGSLVSMNLESYKRPVSAPPQLEEVSIGSDD